VKLELTARAKECTERINELTSEYNDYQMLVSCIKALQAVKIHPDRFKYSNEDYDKVVNTVRDLCARHEIRLPDDTEWESVDII
jgi:hypothetical protein